MPEYSLEFAKRLRAAATHVIGDGLDDPDAGRTVLYLSLLSTEITIKAILEKCGVATSNIRDFSHRLDRLLAELDKCRHTPISLPGIRALCSRIRSYGIYHDGAKITVGALIDSLHDVGASSYPSGVRYGQSVIHYHPEVVAEVAARVIEFAEENWETFGLQ